MQGNVIAAISTPPGKGGVAVIRISGNGALEIAERVFLPVSKRPIGKYPPRTQIYGYVMHGGEAIDDGMLTFFKGPKSYTGEDTVEISCHGGRLITSLVLEALLAAGASPAEPGEFTQRAFVNGKLSLSEAEAIATVLEAQSYEQIRLSSGPSRERLTAAIDDVRKDVTDVISSIYARIDYPDEDLGDFTDDETVARLNSIKAKIQRLIDTYKTGKAINEGISAVICGKPNVGKSTLYNLLLGEDAAIVTDIAGTTRDVLERTVAVGRVLLKISDTAGVRSSNVSDTVEKIGIERAVERVRRSELVLSVFDLSRPLDDEDEELLALLREVGGCKICILNKYDAAEASTAPKIPDGIFDATLTLSAAKDGAAALDSLNKLINSLFTDEKISPTQEAIVSSARQHSALLKARELIASAINAYNLGLPADAASSDIEMALGAIAELDGRGVSDTVVSDIFSKFCVGK